MSRYWSIKLSATNVRNCHRQGDLRPPLVSASWTAPTTSLFRIVAFHSSDFVRGLEAGQRQADVRYALGSLDAPFELGLRTLSRRTESEGATRGDRVRLF